MGLKLLTKDAVKVIYGNNSTEQIKEIFDLIESEMDEEDIQKHKKDKKFMQQLKDFYPEKWEKWNENK